MSIDMRQYEYCTITCPVGHTTSDEPWLTSNVAALCARLGEADRTHRNTWRRSRSNGSKHVPTLKTSISRGNDVIIGACTSSPPRQKGQAVQVVELLSTKLRRVVSTYSRHRCSTNTINKKIEPWCVVAAVLWALQSKFLKFRV